MTIDPGDASKPDDPGHPLVGDVLHHLIRRWPAPGGSGPTCLAVMRPRSAGRWGWLHFDADAVAGAAYFGTDLAEVTARWWTHTFAAVVDAKYPGAALAVVALRSDTTPDWRDPTAVSAVLVELRHGPGDTDPLVANIAHKLRFTLRTGLDSADARRHSHLIEPGDFPHGGGVSHRGVVAGVSGLAEGSDDWVARQVVDHLLAVRRGIADAAVAASRRQVPDWAYLPDDVPPPPD